MPDIFYLFSKWWKSILIIVLISLFAAGLITFFKPRQYLSTTTAIPANVVVNDKARIFSENIEGLYSNLGSPDDLDMIVGTAQLDTVYLAVCDQFNLFDHYKISNIDIRIKAARLLKKYSRVIKSGYGQLQVKVWDTDKKLAPQLSDAIVSKLEAIHSQLQNENNHQALISLQKAIIAIQLNIDSINSLHIGIGSTEQTTDPYTVRRKVLLNQLEQYQTLAGQYQLLTTSGSQVLLLIEKGRPAVRPDRPDWIMTMVSTAFLSFIFAFFTALIMEKRKPNQQ